MSLTQYEGCDVVQSTIRVVGAGDGLSDALSIDEAEFHIGERVKVVLDCVVSKVTYDPIKDTDVLRRVHTLKTDIGTIVDGKLVNKVLESHRRKLDEAKGQGTLGLDEADAD